MGDTMTEVLDIKKSMAVNAPGVGDLEKLPNGVKDCAKAIVDCIYWLDGFWRINRYIKVMEQNIKLDTSGMDGLLPSGNWLRFMFTRPSSPLYYPEKTEGKARVFEPEYTFTANGEEIRCRLTTEWQGSELKENASGGNYLRALIKVVNKYYGDVLEIKEQSGEYYLNWKFSLAELTDAFDAAFSRRYITSLLAKPFVILTGGSGTGKTRISKQFAEYMEVIDADGERNWQIVPVGADWTDNTKILGFYNPLAGNGTGKYEKTEILRLIERANKHPDVPYFFILDEMNLSHVERYFSDFLSHMETPDNPFELDGYVNADSAGEYNGSCKLKYPENLFVTGTVNIDETTYMFSPKVLDRANVVEFKPDKDSVLAMFISSGSHAKVSQAKTGVAKAFLKLAYTIREGKCDLSDDQLQKAKDIFTSIYDITEKSGYEFAYRTVREIRQYLSAAVSLAAADSWSEESLLDAIDEQLLQKVLPKIHGNRKEIGNMLDELEKLCNQDGKELKLSAKKIEQMKGRLAAVQYASFI